MEEGINEFKLFDMMGVPNKNGRIYRYNDFLQFENKKVFVYESAKTGITLGMEGIVGKAVIKCKLGNIYALYQPITDHGQLLMDLGYKIRTKATTRRINGNIIIPTSIISLFFTNDPA